MRLSTNYFRLKITICLLFVFIFVFNNCYSLTMPTEFDEESSINSGSKEIEKEIDELVDIYREKSNGIISGDAWPSAIFISLLKEINNKFAMSLKYSDILQTKDYQRLATNTDWTIEDFEQFKRVKDSFFNELENGLKMKVLEHYTN